jgi:hypothetical protein
MFYHQGARDKNRLNCFVPEIFFSQRNGLLCRLTLMYLEFLATPGGWFWEKFLEKLKLPRLGVKVKLPCLEKSSCIERRIYSIILT